MGVFSFPGSAKRGEKGDKESAGARKREGMPENLYVD